MPTFLKSLKAALYRPTSSISGDEAPTLFRGVNWSLRGARTENPYFEVFRGNLDLREGHAMPLLSGSASLIAGYDIVQGDTECRFTDELGLGQHLMIGDQVLSVKQIINDSSFRVWRAPLESASTVQIRAFPQISELNGQRLVMTRGGAIETSRGHIIAVGAGEVRLNGAVLPGESLTATRRPQLALYRAATRDYVVQDLGYTTTPPQPSIQMTDGGTKALKDLSRHSFMFSWWSGPSIKPDGFSNPCEPVKLDSDGNELQIVIADSKTRFLIDFTASVADPPANAKGFLVWQSLEGSISNTDTGSTLSFQSLNDSYYRNGPWFKAATIAFEDLDADNSIIVEYADRDLNDEVSGNNDAVPEAEFVAKVAGRAMYISCYGSGTQADGSGGAPGPAVSITKADNPDAAPADWVATLDNTIIGWIKTIENYLMLTTLSLERVFYTGLVGQTTDQGTALELPIASTPYWQTGAANRYSIIMVDRFLYGRSGGKFVRSTAEGDSFIKAYDFGPVVEDITRTWNDGHVLTGDDSQNAQVCFFHLAAYKNDSGYWVTEILPFTLYDVWMPKIVLSRTDRDMVVSGVAKVNNHLEFLCGGRVEGGGHQVRTYRWGEGTAGLGGEAYLVWQPSDDSANNVDKEISELRLTGKMTSPNIQIHGSRTGGSISIANMENGTDDADPDAFFSGSIAFPATSKITNYMRRRLRFKRLNTYAIRVSTAWDGTGDPDRLDEVVVSVGTHGRPK